MLGLAIDGVSKRFGSVTALDDVSLSIEPGQLICFLGPSGCGKTTLLRIVAGLDSPDRGTVRLNGNDITDLPANRRGFGMVFQSLALFPHLDVAENIAYSLKLRSRSARERRDRVEELLAMIRLPGIGKRRIGQLSGGQRQRVAIARALAQDPALLLLDEPLSALDAKLREEMQVELKQLLQQLKLTTILVTHDQREAMTLGDRIVVMSEARIRQMGDPVEIYRAPADRFVASFIGRTNLMAACVEDDRTVRIGDHLTPVDRIGGDCRNGRNVTLSIRPEEVRISQPNGAMGLRATLAFVRDLGSSIEVHLDFEGRKLIGVTSPREWWHPAVGDQVALGFAPGACRVLAD